MNELDTVMALLATKLATAMPSRVITRSLKDAGQRPDADLRLGVLTVIAANESGFDNQVRGREADLGTLSVKFIAQLLVAADSQPVAIETAEGLFIQEVKEFCRAVPAGFDFVYLNDWRNSTQIDHPYGWVVFDLSVRPAS